MDPAFQKTIERALRNLPRSNVVERSPALLSRSPEEVAEAKDSEDRSYAYISAAIDFLYQAGENAMRERTRHLLRVHSQQCQKRFHGEDAAALTNTSAVTA